MSRRKPTEMKRFEGTLRRDRTNPREPRPPTAPAGYPDAPVGMPSEVDPEYHEFGALVSLMPGVATDVDGPAGRDAPVDPDGHRRHRQVAPGP